MFSKQVKERSAALMFKLGVALLVILFVVVFGPGLLKLESSQALAKKKKGRYCTQTAEAAYKACIKEKQDDYNIAYGKCINVSDRDAREECFDEAKNGEDGYKEAISECKDQREARRDVCDDLGEDRYDPDLSPGNFTSTIDNSYFPLSIGDQFTYHSIASDGTTVLQTVVITVEDITSINGFPCLKVTDKVYDGNTLDPGDHKLLEDTIDWYSQDSAGNVWYFGETTIAYTYDLDGNPTADNEGSWKAFENGAKPGIIMPANPAGQIDLLYRQEFDLGTAEDLGKVVETGVTAPDTSYTDCVHTEDSTPMEPDIIEDKYYASGVGLVLTVEPEATEVLISGP